MVKGCCLLSCKTAKHTFQWAICWSGCSLCCSVTLLESFNHLQQLLPLLLAAVCPKTLPDSSLSQVRYRT